MRLTLSNTLNLGRMQAIDFLSWSSRTLQTHTFCEIKRATEDIDQLFIALNLSSDIAFKTSQVSS